MKQVGFSEDSLSIIRKYIFHLKNYYFALYSDTGLWNEIWILDEYDNKTELLLTSFIDGITEKLSYDIVPYEITWDLRKSVFTIENRRLEVTYLESAHERNVYDIQVQYRK